MIKADPRTDTSNEIIILILDDIAKKGKCVIQKAGQSPIEVSYNTDARWYEVSQDGVVIAKSLTISFIKSVLTELVYPMIYRHTKKWIEAMGQPNLFIL